MILDEIVRAIVQIIILILLPVLWWIITARKKDNFFHWIGLQKPRIIEKWKFAICAIVAVVVAVSMSFVLDALLPDDTQLANERFSGLGFQALIPAIIFAIFATGLPEEILFRGFLGKRLSGKLGFAAGNTIQAIVFELAHGVTMFGVFNIEIPLLVIAFTGALGWLMGYMDEKADGSIIPSICLHGLSNIYACIIIMFA